MKNNLVASFLFLALFTATFTGTSAAAAKKSPNIILILADDLGYSDLGCYGGEINTPNIDQLGKNGVRFTQMYNSARCCPSRASIMTGLYPSQAGIADFTSNPNLKRGPGYLGRLTDNCVTLAEVLKPAGYNCYYVGKWHLNEATGPIARGFDEFYGYTKGYAADQFSPNSYHRLPLGREKEINPPQKEFYATDVFSDYAIEFIRQAKEKEDPWFLFLSHSSPHFPVQAPAERADKYDAIYQRGWDVLRRERFERMKKIGLVNGKQWQLSPRSMVPVDRDDIANGYSGKPNPAWDTLEEERQFDLARRMAIFAAMVESVDTGVGEIVELLEKNGDYENTLIIFLSDNGACYEWGPFGFDGGSRQGKTVLHKGDDLRKIGQPGTHQAYGSGWANLGNTPRRLYKHFTSEGGIGTPFIMHWPKGIRKGGTWIREPAHIMDILPTVLEVAGAKYPEKSRGFKIIPKEGKSLLSVVRNASEGVKSPERTLGFSHQGAKALRKGDWKIVWGKRQPEKVEWELYNIAEDRCELNNLAKKYPERVETMAQEWDDWARHVNVIYEGPPLQPKDVPDYSPKKKQAPTCGCAKRVDDASPAIAKTPITILGEVAKVKSKNGVIVAHGGIEFGYAVHLVDGKLAFDVRPDGKITRIIAKEKAPVNFRFTAVLNAKKMTLKLNDKIVAEADSPGLIAVQPKDPMSIGHDTLSSAGQYISPNTLDGEVSKVRVASPKPTCKARK